jgi:hypothetical protein
MPRKIARAAGGRDRVVQRVVQRVEEWVEERRWFDVRLAVGDDSKVLLGELDVE